MTMTMTYIDILGRVHEPALHQARVVRQIRVEYRVARDRV